MQMPALTREVIIGSIAGSLEALPWVDALWEGGSAAFGLADQWSDVDLQAVVEDARVEELFAALESRLESLSPIRASFRVPEPAWHGHSQRFYVLEAAGPYLIVDFCAMRRSSPNWFLEREIHGTAKFSFDRGGIGSSVKPGDPSALDSRLRERLPQLGSRFRIFQPLVTKECLRGHPLDAMHFYLSFTLAPLVELLRIKHDPWRYNFGWRYLWKDLPAGEHSRLLRLAFPARMEAIPALQEEAVGWFEQLSGELSARATLAPAVERP